MQNHTNNKTASTPTSDQLWQDICDHALEAGLDPQKFTSAHQEIVTHIVNFLHTPHSKISPKDNKNKQKNWLPSRLSNRFQVTNDEPYYQPIAPIIICGEPGTGKTTFLYLLDNILRQAFDLPDNVRPVMMKENGRYHTIFKRRFNGTAVSLLSVKKWSQLLYFYAWDVQQHKLDTAVQDVFIENTLMPMRILFADEVEMTGYSPTIHDLAKHGILVVGTSNQYEFKQLVDREIPPHIYRFQGIDMRLGDPTDAVITTDDPLDALFTKLQNQPLQRTEQLHFRRLQDEAAVFLFTFHNAVEAPFLETEWVQFFQSFPLDQQASQSIVLLFDQFSLDNLKANYNAIIRFVSLFDAIEQLGLGVLVRNLEDPPHLSKQDITNLKTHIYNAIGVPEEIKQKTVVGLDRCTSRLGQAGHKAHAILSKAESA